MPEWLIGLIGAFIGGGGVLLGTYLTHRWKRSERYQELLAEKRLLGCEKLMGSLTEISEELSPSEKGIKPLLDLSTSQRIIELGKFAATNEGILGKTVMGVWYKYYQALLLIQSDAFYGDTQEKSKLPPALRKLLKEWNDKMRQAVSDELHSINIEFITSSELEQLTKEGHKIAEEFIKNKRDNIE